MKMVKKAGKMVPSFAADGKGKMQMGGAKKYQDGGTPSYRDQKKAAKQDQKLAAINAKTERIKAGTEPSTYEKVANITGNVAKTAVAAGETAKAISDARRPSGAGGPGGMQKGGMVKKYKTGGMVNSNAKVSASKVAGGRPAKSAEPKSASKRATGRVGGTSTAPKTAMPKRK